MSEHQSQVDAALVEARRTSFGAGAATYDAVRPPWPEEAVDWMLGGPAAPLRVVDLGAGTGIGTRTVARLGHEVVAVDPSAEMLAALEAASARLPDDVAGRIRSRVGGAESLEEADGSVDAVTVFQAWHWFDPERAGAECARVLRPGGMLSMGWHSWSDRQPWLRELGEVVGTPEMVWDPATRGLSAQPPRIDGFAHAENRQLAVEQRLTVDELVALASSWSPVAVRSDRDDVLAAVRRLGERVARTGSTGTRRDGTNGDRTNGDGGDGTVVFGYVTDCYRYRRTP